MSRQLSATFLITVLIIGAGLRIWSTGGDLWIDEVWSLDQLATARASDNPQDWIALFFHANTHAINTLYMALVDTLTGPNPPPFAYRLLSLITGIATVGVASWWGWQRSPAIGVITALLFSLSYPLINYSGEARGYAPMMLAALIAAYALEQHLKNPTPRTVTAFVTASLIGLMSHLTFVVIEAGLGIWAAWEIYHLTRRSLVSTFAKLVPLFGAQLILVTAFSAIAINSMVRGGDCCPEPALDSIRIMADWMFGVDANAITSLLPLFILTGIIITTLVRLAKDGERVWIMLAIVIIVFPLVTLIIETKPDVIHRYFLPSALFTLLLVAGVLSWAWESRGWKRWLSVSTLFLFCLGNASLLMKFSDGGRGQYQKAIQTIANTSGDPQLISGYPAFSVGSLVRHHIKVLDYENRLSFVADGKEANWFIHGYLDGKPAKAEVIRTDSDGKTNTYSLVKIFPQWGLSGDAWALYRLK